MLRLAARLPDPLVGLAPDARRALRLRLDDRPQPPREPLAAARVQQDRVQRGAVDVVLALVERAVADPHRARAGVAGELVDRRLGQVAAPVDAVHDLQRAVGVGLEVGDELHELVGLPVEVQPVQRLQREGRVADPGVAVVPVALAARRLGQRGGERGDRRAGRHVREALDRERRALDRLAPAVVGDPRARDPRRARSASSPRAGRSPRRRRPATRAPPPTTASRTRRSPCLQQPARADAVALEPEQQVGRSRRVRPAPLASAAWRSSPTSVHSGRDAAVVEHRLADEVDVDAALDALDRAHEQVVGVVVERRARVRRDRVLDAPRAERERVAHDDPPGRHVPGGDQRVRARLVLARGRARWSPNGPSRKWPRLAVQQRAEHARASRSAGRTASRSRRRAPRARPCGSSTGTRSRRSAGTATARRRSAACALDVGGGGHRPRSLAVAMTPPGAASSPVPDDGGRDAISA